MTKQEQFLFVVQTTVLANCTNLASMPDRAEKYRADISATGVKFKMAEALNASNRITDDMEAIEAAGDFCNFMLTNIRDQAEEAEEKPMRCPSWFARG